MGSREQATEATEGPLELGVRVQGEGYETDRQTEEREGGCAQVTERLVGSLRGSSPSYHDPLQVC